MPRRKPGKTGQALPLPPVQTKPITAPRAGSRQAIAQEYLENWCAAQAEAAFPKKNRTFKMPANFFMPDRMLWSVCDVFKLAKTEENFKGATEDLVMNLIGGEFESWDQKHRLPDLVEELNRIAPKVYEDAKRMTEARSKKSAENRARRAAAAGPSNTAGPSHTAGPQPQETPDTRRRRLQEAIRNSAMQEILRKRAVLDIQAQARARAQAHQAEQAEQTQTALTQSEGDIAVADAGSAGFGIQGVEGRPSSPLEHQTRAPRRRIDDLSSSGFLVGEAAITGLANVNLTTRSGLSRKASSKLGERSNGGDSTCTG